MNARINYSGNKVRQAVLAGILTLAGSAAANAAAPEAPFIDWVEATPLSGEDGDLVAVDVGWSRYDFDEVDSVQYRHNGKPVMSRAVDPGQISGDTALTFEGQNGFDFTVALCNVDGCTESAQIEISISDEYGVEVLIQDAPASSDPFSAADSWDYVPQAQAMPQFSTFAMPATVVNGLASELGKAALSGLVRAGADAGFSTVLKFLGLGDMAIGTQVQELQSSVKAMNGKIDSLSKTLDSIENRLIWKDFTDQHDSARATANKIMGAYDDVVGWLSTGQVPDREGWTGARAKVVESLEELSGTKSGNGGGIADVYDGAVYRLMNAVPQQVATVESYWPIVEEYRDYYRMAISIGFLTLDLIADEFDGTNTTRIQADNALAAGQAAVFNMYNYGVAPETPRSGSKVLDFVQLRSSTTAYAARELADHVSYSSVALAGSKLRTDFAKMASNYNPDHHQGMTLEQLLVEANVPTTWVLDDTGGGHYKTGWQFDIPIPPGDPMSTKYWWELRPLVGQVKGNKWVESYERYCPSGAVPCEGQSGWFYGSTSDAKNQVSARISAIKAAGGYTLNNGRYASAYYGKVDLTDRLSHAGRAAEMDEALVRLAAFGDGAAKIQAGMLPDGYGASQCIGLPQSAEYLMEVDNYHLRWQPDGNLTLRDADNKILWQTGTGSKGKQLCFYEYGNMAIDNNIKVLFSSDTSDWDLGGYGGRALKLQQDGALQIVNELGDAVWQVGPFE